MPSNENISLNLLNLELDDPDEQCMICHENINKCQTYKLPECGHEYHTHCLISWFRNGDSRCPYCGNKGINNCKDKEHRSWRSWRRSRYLMDHSAKFNEIRKYSRSDNANPLIIKAFQKLEKLIEIYKEKKDEFKSFNEKLKSEEVNYHNAAKERRELRRKLWTADNNVMKQKNSIIDFHVVPLIIPMPIDIN